MWISLTAHLGALYRVKIKRKTKYALMAELADAHGSGNATSVQLMVKPQKCDFIYVD